MAGHPKRQAERNLVDEKELRKAQWQRAGGVEWKPGWRREGRERIRCRERPLKSLLCV